MKRWLGITAVLALLTGCAWVQYGGNAGRTAYAPLETTLTAANAPDVTVQWASDHAVGGDAAIANGFVYISSSGFLDAWKLDAEPPCGPPPSSCVPTWFAHFTAAATSAPVVMGHTVYVVGADPTTWTLYAFDAHGRGDCPGGPIGCRARWTATFGSHAAGGTYAPSLLAADGRIYALTVETGTLLGDITAFDAAALTNCAAGSPTCAPAFHAPLGPVYPSEHAAIDGGYLYASTASGVVVFDATGAAGCTAGTCQPLRKLVADSPGEPAAGDGQVFVTEGSLLVAFDGTGATGCSGSPVVCTRRWTAPLVGGGSLDSPIVTPDRVLATSTTGPESRVEAFDRRGVTGCSGSPITCTPIWRTAGTTIYGTAHAIATANLLIVASNQLPNPSTLAPIAVQVTVFDVSAQTSCAGTPTTCQPVHTVPLGTISPYDQSARPATSNGRIVASTAASGFFMLGLP